MTALRCTYTDHLKYLQKREQEIKFLLIRPKTFQLENYFERSQGIIGV